MSPHNRLILIIGWTVIVGLQLVTYGLVDQMGDRQRRIVATQNQAVIDAVVERIDLLEETMGHMGESRK